MDQEEQHIQSSMSRYTRMAADHELEATRLDPNFLASRATRLGKQDNRVPNRIVTDMCRE